MLKIIEISVENLLKRILNLTNERKILKIHFKGRTQKLMRILPEITIIFVKIISKEFF